jgi:hypothetical protein
MSGEQEVVVDTGGPTGGGTENPDTVRFINENDDIVPQYMRKELLWGFLNKAIGMGKFEPKQALAAKHWMEAAAIWMKMSVPAEEVTNPFILDIDNSRFYFRFQVNRATVPQTERQMIVKQVRESHTLTNSGGRGGVLGGFRLR